jgi:hypothetical protein
VVNEVTWRDAVHLCNELLERLYAHMQKHPENAETWQKDIDDTLAKRQKFLILAQWQEEAQFMQALSTICDNISIKSKESKMPHNTSKCALEECKEPAYTGNGMGLSSPIGYVVVFLCTQHFSDAIRANMTRQGQETYQKMLEREQK